MRFVVSFIIVAVLLSGLCREASAISIGVGTRINKPVEDFRKLRKKNIVSQTLDYSCGPASLATLLSYYFQDKVTEAQIIKYLLLTTELEKVKERRGFSLLDLKNFAKARGYEVIGYRMDLEYLVSLEQPVLIPLYIKDYSHFVIFRGLKGSRVFLADPALGNMTMRVDKFLDLWRDGIGMVVSKTDKKFEEGPLVLSEAEKAVFADPNVMRKLFAPDIIGKIYADDEF